jgi:hypothetical protein
MHFFWFKMREIWYFQVWFSFWVFPKINLYLVKKNYLANSLNLGCTWPTWPIRPAHSAREAGVNPPARSDRGPRLHPRAPPFSLSRSRPLPMSPPCRRRDPCLPRPAPAPVWWGPASPQQALPLPLLRSDPLVLNRSPPTLQTLGLLANSGRYRPAPAPLAVHWRGSEPTSSTPTRSHSCGPAKP